MKKKLIFILKCILLCFVLFYFCFFIVMPQYTINFQASLNDKNDRLLQTEGPKIVLVGNSNLVFGIQSNLIEEAFQMPIINMGLHGGVGNAFNEQAAVQNVDEGDVVILSISNFADDDNIKNPKLVWITIENHLKLYRYIRMKDWPTMAKAYPTYLKSCLEHFVMGTGNRDSGDLYSRNQFNEYGDSSAERLSYQEVEEPYNITIPSINETTIQRLNQLNETVTSQGGTLLLASYPVMLNDSTPSKEEYAKFTKELNEKLEFPVISKFEDYQLDQSLFYDTYLHLTNEGANIRTNLLIKDLKGYLEEMK